MMPGLYLFKIGRECRSCRNDVAVFNMSYFGKYYLLGPDAQKAADWIFTNDMRKPAGTNNSCKQFLLIFGSLNFCVVIC